MVPTATTGAPRSRAAATAATVSAGHREQLRVHRVIVEVVGGDGLERAQPDVERDGRDGDAAGAHPLQEGGGHVEPGRRRGHRAGDPGEDGLVALAILRLVRAVEVGRQRHVARSLERGVQREPRGREQHHLHEAAVADGRGDLGHEHGVLGAPIVEHQAGARAQRLAGAAERAPPLRGEIAALAVHRGLCEPPHQEQLDLAAAPGLVPEEARGDDARVVDHQQRAGGEELIEIAHGRVRGRPHRDHEQPRAVALGSRAAGDEIGRELVIEELAPHALRR